MEGILTTAKGGLLSFSAAGVEPVVLICLRNYEMYSSNDATLSERDETDRFFFPVRLVRSARKVVLAF